MKMRSLVLVLMCLLLMSPCIAQAKVPVFVSIVQEEAMPAASGNTAERSLKEYQTCYRNVTHHYLDAQGNEVNSQTLFVPMVEIVYRYVLIKGTTSESLLGGYVEADPSSINVVGNVMYDIDRDHVADFASAYVEVYNAGQAYTLHVLGGYFNLTYNTDLYFDYNGNIVDEMTERTTARIGYYYTYPGTMADFYR